MLLKKPLKPASLRSWLSGLKISSALIKLENARVIKAHFNPLKWAFLIISVVINLDLIGIKFYANVHKSSK